MTAYYINGKCLHCGNPVKTDAEGEVQAPYRHPVCEATLRKFEALEKDIEKESSDVRYSLSLLDKLMNVDRHRVEFDVQQLRLALGKLQAQVSAGRVADLLARTRRAVRALVGDA